MHVPIRVPGEPDRLADARRLAELASYDLQVINAIIDEALACHVGFVHDERPVVIPTIHARSGDTIYLHGSPASRMLRVLKRGAEVCVTFTLIDGLIMARAPFHSSLSYRSVVLFGAARPVADVAEKQEAFRLITEHVAHAGEQTGGRRLFTIVDTSVVWADLAIFPGDRARVGLGTDVTVTPATGGRSVGGTISNINVLAAANQAVTARVVLDNADGSLAPGTYVTGEILVAEHQVPLAVRRVGLQSFRDFTVVYAQVGEQYEVRMLDLGRQAGEWAEVLGGLDPGTVYVTEGSYVLKADVEKTGATHDH